MLSTASGAAALIAARSFCSAALSAAGRAARYESVSLGASLMPYLTRALDGRHVGGSVPNEGDLDHHLDTDLGHAVHEPYLAVELGIAERAHHADGGRGGASDQVDRLGYRAGSVLIGLHSVARIDLVQR